MMRVCKSLSLKLSLRFKVHVLCASKGPQADLSPLPVPSSPLYYFVKNYPTAGHLQGLSDSGKYSLLSMMEPYGTPPAASQLDK